MFLSKYSASGNDFLITHAFSEDDYSAMAKKLCDRHNGLGADGFIVVIPSKKADIKWLFYNSDGSVASMCGNGTRATALYALQNGLASRNMTLETAAGIIDLAVDGNVVSSKFSTYAVLERGIQEFGAEWVLIDTGVPHLVTLAEDKEALEKEQLRTLRYKYNANVNVGSVTADGGIFIRTYERGVEDETLACGTGMAALFCLLLERGKVAENVVIVPKSGEELAFIKKEGSIFFKGKVSNVFDTIIPV